jgi:hypothetical protein
VDVSKKEGVDQVFDIGRYYLKSTRAILPGSYLLIHDASGDKYIIHGIGHFCIRTSSVGD